MAVRTCKGPVRSGNRGRYVSIVFGLFVRQTACSNRRYRLHVSAGEIARKPLRNVRLFY